MIGVTWTQRSLSGSHCNVFWRFRIISTVLCNYKSICFRIVPLKINIKNVMKALLEKGSCECLFNFSRWLQKCLELSIRFLPALIRFFGFPGSFLMASYLTFVLVFVTVFMLDYRKRCFNLHQNLDCKHHTYWYKIFQKKCLTNCREK